ncbi:MAG: retron Ec78 anti-phage system effector HNH endonuclease PtuB [Mariprofundales bacterium]
MHQLERPSAPACLVRFRHGLNNWNDVLPADKDEIWQQLNQMQQQRCAYCECSIAGEKKAHIEHLRQRSRYPQGTFEWGNLFGSCNHVDSCGKHKDACGAYNYYDLIKMDEEDPEHFFIFIADGTIAVRSGLSDDEKHRAKETLRIFNLDAQHGRLRQMRQSAVQGYVQTAEELLAIAENFDENEWMPLLQQELNTIKNQPFATAIKHVLAP